MWYKVKYTIDEDHNGKPKHKTYYYLVDKTNFAEAGFEVMKYNNNEGEVEDVMLLKAYRPIGNNKYSDENKVFVVKIVEDFTMADGSSKELKYIVPFFANSNEELQNIVKDYMAQGLEDMRITNIMETKFIVLLKR